MTEDGILTSTKKLLGIGEDYTHFDTDIVTFINMAFATLNQIGVGPKEGYRIESKDNKWDEFTDGAIWLEDVKSYIYLKTRLIFDPPSNSFLITAINDQIRELEWRLSVKGEEGHE